MLHSRNGKNWIRLPAQGYRKADRTDVYRKILEFTHRQISDNFSEEVIRVLEREGLLK